MLRPLILLLAACLLVSQVIGGLISPQREDDSAVKDGAIVKVESVYTSISNQDVQSLPDDGALGPGVVALQERDFFDDALGRLEYLPDPLLCLEHYVDCHNP